MFRWTVGVLVCLGPSVALAASAPRALVVVMDGNDRGTRREIYDAIARDMRVEAPDVFNAALENEGVTGALGEALANPRTRKPTIAAVRKTLQSIDAPAVVSVQVTRKGAIRDVRIVAIVSSQAGPMIEQDFHLSPGERAAAQLVPLLSASLPELVRSPQASADAGLPSKPTTEKKAAAEPESRADATSPSGQAKEKKAAVLEESRAEDSSPSPADRDHVTGTSANPDRAHSSSATWIVHVGIELARRDLQYSDPWAGRLRPHLAPAIAAYAVGAELYPGASTGTPVMKDLGLVARFADSLPFDSASGDGQTARGGFRRYAAGIRGRIRAGGNDDSPLLGIEGTYGMWQVAFTGPDQVVDEAPSVAYSHVRAGVDGRFPFGAFAVVGNAGYMFVSSAGRYTDRFPNATVGGVDAAVGGTWAVASFVELRLSVAYTRFFSSAHPEPGARYIAGGALDQYIVTSLGASAAFR